MIKTNDYLNQNNFYARSIRCIMWASIKFKAPIKVRKTKINKFGFFNFKLEI